MTAQLLTLVEDHDYQTLFIEKLRWSRPDMKPITVKVSDEKSIVATNVSSYKGIRVWVCPELPSSSDQAFVVREIAKKTTDRIVIFHNEDKQVWRWPSRITKDSGVTTRLTSHVHVKGRENPKLIARLNKITLDAREDLSPTDVLNRVKQAFDVETEKESKRASKLMASMYDALNKVGTPEHDISVTLARILFLMFGDDTDMWQENLFQEFIISHTADDGADLAERLNELFEYLNTKQGKDFVGPERHRGFRYVNGGLFSEKITLRTVGPELRKTILDASTTDWSDISPAIFGSMFQSVRNAEIRRQFGEHYTSEKDILRTLNPLFLDELRQEFLDACEDPKNARKRLRALRNKLGRIQFLDPACGCGNFIIIAYRELRLLEISIIEKLRELMGSKARFSQGQAVLVAPEVRKETAEDNNDFLDDPTPVVILDNYYGIEIDGWPAKIAETAMFLTDQQCDLEMHKRIGYAPDRLPISRQATIVTATLDDPNAGNALRLDWKALFTPDDETIVAGNPPYIGYSMRSDSQTADLRHVWVWEYDGYFDYVTGWHAQALDFLEDVDDAKFAFVTTNSISQGQQVASLFGPIFRRGWRVRFAHRTFPWESEASGKAAVHCVIVGFDKDSSEKAQLWEYDSRGKEILYSEVPNINGYLVDAPNIEVTSESQPISLSLPSVNYGSKPADGRGLLIKTTDLEQVLEDPIAAKYVRPFIGADELIKGTKRWCLWLVDAPVQDLKSSEVLRSRLGIVRDMRLGSSKENTRKLGLTPHLFSEIRQPMTNYLCIPRVVSENRQFFTAGRYDSEVIASDAVFTAEDSDGLLFAIVSSTMFIVWQKLVGGRLKSDYRFSNTIVWNNFPIGDIPSVQRELIVSAGSAVMAIRRKYPDRSLESLYGPGTMPDDLAEAHHALDQVVDSFFDVEEGSTSLDRQRLLLERYDALKKS